MSNCVLTYAPDQGEQKQFIESNLFYADPTIFDMLGISLSKGDLKTAISQPNTVVLNQKTAQKYFGEADPMGKGILVEDGHGHTRPVSLQAS